MKTSVLLSSSLLLAAAPSAEAALLYATTPVAQSVRFSDYSQSAQRGFRVYDAFTITSDAAVERVTWTGLWLDLAAPIPSPALPEDAGLWEVAFHASNGAAPGAPLSTQTMPAASVATTFLGTGLFNVAGNTYNVSYYHYAVDLPSAFAADGGTPYWLSVFASGGQQPQQFAWLGGLGGDASSLQQQLGFNMVPVNSFASVAADRAFELHGTVPEPSALLLAGTAALALLRRRRTTR